jgi:GNAT superfamily N-acetyltransferase
MYQEPELDPFYNLYYSFDSSLETNEPGDLYQNTINIDLCLTDEHDRRLKTVGKAQIKILLLESATMQGCSAIAVFDSDGWLMEIGEEIYDFELEVYLPEFLDSLNLDIANQDIAILTTLEILPEYRGRGLGKMVVRDIFRRFRNSVGLFMVEVYPLQHAYHIGDESWKKEMEYSKMEKDFEISDLKIKAFYKSLGFRYHENFPHLMFCDPSDLVPELDDYEENDEMPF